MYESITQEKVPGPLFYLLAVVFNELSLALLFLEQKKPHN